jgi:hypothetical protein
VKMSAQPPVWAIAASSAAPGASSPKQRRRYLVPPVWATLVTSGQKPALGEVPDIYVSLKPGTAPSKEIANDIPAAAIPEIGPLARPYQVITVPDMPTRSGKIMRRVLAAISNHQAGDVSTPANPEIVERIRDAVNGLSGSSSLGSSTFVSNPTI